MQRWLRMPPMSELALSVTNQSFGGGDLNEPE